MTLNCNLFDRLFDFRFDVLNTKQRVLQFRLLTQLCHGVNSDTPELPRIEKQVIISLKQTGEECFSSISLLSVIISKTTRLTNLGEILGLLAVVTRLHTGTSCSLLPTSLPVLNFSQAAVCDQPVSREPDTSDSEMSDGDMPGDHLQRRRIEMKIQKEALVVLALIAKRIAKKEVVSFWFLFLPDKSFSPLSSSVTELCCHSNKRVRLQALGILAEFLSHIGPFLALAQHSVKITSYTSLSTALAVSLATAHRLLLEKLCPNLLGPTEQVATLKIVGLLAEHCPYHRLQPSILEQLISSCLGLAKQEKNPVIQVAVMSVFCILCQHKATDTSFCKRAGSLFGLMVNRAHPDTVSLYPDNNVRYMALQALSGLTNVDINIFIRNASDVKKLLDVSLVDTDPSVVLHAFRFIKNFARNLTSIVDNERKSDGSDKIRNLATAFWVDFLKQSNFKLLDKHPNANIKSAFCDCISEMGGFLYDELPQPKKIVVLSYILSQCQEDQDQTGQTLDRQIQDRAALSSSLRTLGIMIMYPSYLTDTAFHIDVADAVLPHLSPAKPPLQKSNAKALDPSNKAVKIAASWALANLTDTLVQADGKCEEEFPVVIARKILYRAIDVAEDSSSAVNTQSNAVRCVGNLLYLTRSTSDIEDEWLDVMGDGVNCIIHFIRNGKIMKIRWNACYAAGNVLKKEELNKNYSWKVNLIKCLLEIVLNYPNFKVRINAALALGSPVTRDSLGDQYWSVLAGLMESLGNTHDHEVAGEWTHMENLRDQLVLSLCHLVSLCVLEKEFLEICSLIHEHYDLVEGSIRITSKRISPEKSSPFLAVSGTAECFGKSYHGNREDVLIVTKMLTQLSVLDLAF